MEVQVFGTKNDSDTRKALRFFSERRIKTHFVDLKQKPASMGELKRFVQKFGADRLVNRDSKRFKALGLQTAYYGDERWLQILAEEPLVLSIPLVRYSHRLTIGHAPSDWLGWIDEK
jgi:arsenate reductase